MYVIREVDEAMLRRLEKRILIGLPSEPARQAMISHWLPPVCSSGGAELRTQLDYETLAKVNKLYNKITTILLCALCVCVCLYVMCLYVYDFISVGDCVCVCV